MHDKINFTTKFLSIDGEPIFGLFFISQISAEASREEIERRLDKHMNKQNTQLNELMEKLEAQVSFLYSSFAVTGS